MSDLLSRCRGLLHQLHPATETAVTALVSDPAWRLQLDAFAQDRGFDSGPSGDAVIARQASLLALLTALKSALDGGPGTLTPKVALSALTEELSPLDRERYTVAPLSGILAAARTSNELEVGEVAAALGEAPYQDVIGPIYEEVVPQAERRKLGQFWTPRPIADAMARWCIRSSGARVLDPASGAGALLLASLERLIGLGADPASLSAQLHGNDIDPLVRALMLVTLTAYDRVPWEQMELADALTTRTEDAGVFDSIICNPPYTRHHHLPEPYKAQLRTQLSSDLGITTSGFTSLFAYFYLHCLSLLADDGRMSFITPAELFDASYAKVIKQHVLAHVNLRAVVVFGDDFAAFPGVDTAGIITLTEGGDCDGAPVRFIELDAWPGVDELVSAAESGPDGTYPWGRIELKTRDALAQTAKWTVAHRHRVVAHASMVPLKSVARVMRGIATGNNDFFTLTDAEREATGIEDRFLLPVVSKTRDVLTLELTGERHRRLREAGKKAWLFYCQEAPDALTGTSAEAYIQRGDADGVPDGKLISLRSVWYQVERRTPPALIYTYLSRGWPRFIANDLGAQNLNGFHSVMPDEELLSDPVLLAAFCAILNSGVVLDHLRGIGRSYGGGTVKVEPRELDTLPVLDPRSMPDDAVAELAELFSGSRGLLPEAFAPVRERIDALIRAAR